ncbi:MAG: magnesium and cobalt transport protein CorA [Burkholderiales bacterium]|nr:magnesium and cobalt transport protein CorA [Burkholderiales bacterium]MDE2611418.1 magnesium and cobalt transport protein CorA [Burkholderiales bacterium]
MLVNCAAYQDGRKLADIQPNDINTYLSRPGCFVWVALCDIEPGELAHMQRQFGLHDLAVEDATHGHQRAKIDEYGESLFTVLHVIDRHDNGELTQGEIDIFTGPNYVLTVRHGTRQSFKDVRARCEHDPDLLKQGPSFVLYALMDSVVDRYFPLLEDLGAEVDDIEDRLFVKSDTRASRAVIEDMYAIKRRLMMLQHTCAPLLDAVGKLCGGRVPAICQGMQDYFRDVQDHLQRISKVIEGRRDMLTTALQVNLGMISLAESEITKRLGAFAALFAVPTMIAGIYGMNFRDIPELHATYGYPICLLAMLGIDLFLWWRFKKVGWL